MKNTGEENIVTTILYEGLSKEDAEAYERKYRPVSDIGWNIRQGGGNKAKHSPVSNEKNRKAKQGVEYPYEKIFTPEARKKISLSKMGNKNRLGMHNSEETKRKQSISAKKEVLALKPAYRLIKKLCVLKQGLFTNHKKRQRKRQECHTS